MENDRKVAQGLKCSSSHSAPNDMVVWQPFNLMDKSSFAININYILPLVEAILFPKKIADRLPFKTSPIAHNYAIAI